ncbi:hypothetical protein BN7_2337 [Wickerhamomyces ciferrii]|uniref:Mitochondrial import protein 1 n=1 Tax=Wickerhamomyces ciferrii (strain ATCC 14091 / BCRC 22168 / CBS 111 / JCM 3599 / NBRC 0793 / NRRL Y-1031 F-60-10) TaxID=1206466 RepID=K0KNX1_WICCF|nr:uncharacterized protein BN7_2337 [Wickerhamomyces ciferrii]CCH42793.1 hypothetical protein BN7_2337 [Wickerhamomyces ciferrii]
MDSVYSTGQTGEFATTQEVEEQIDVTKQQTINGAQEQQSEEELEVQSEITREEVLQEIYSNNGTYDEDDKQSFSITRFLGRLSVNLILPFINGLMLGFGEIIAHEIGFHYNWTGARVS